METTYYIGQRVLLNNKEIGTVVKPEGTMRGGGMGILSG